MRPGGCGTEVTLAAAVWLTAPVNLGPRHSGYQSHSVSAHHRLVDIIDTNHGDAMPNSAWFLLELNISGPVSVTEAVTNPASWSPQVGGSDFNIDSAINTPWTIDQKNVQGSLL